jgi:hypothetical protein
MGLGAFYQGGQQCLQSGNCYLSFQTDCFARIDPSLKRQATPPGSLCGLDAEK